MATLLAKCGEIGPLAKGGGKGPLVATYQPAFNSLRNVARRLHSMLTDSEHRAVFPEPPLIACRRYKNLKDILVRARLSSEGNRGERD